LTLGLFRGFEPAGQYVRRARFLATKSDRTLLHRVLVNAVAEG
jgi:hypothetical protein